jgi:hypothetical protein
MLARCRCHRARHQRAKAPLPIPTFGSFFAGFTLSLRLNLILPVMVHAILEIRAASEMWRRTDSQDRMDQTATIA